MTCDEWQTLALTGDAAAAEHLESCPGCRDEYAKAQAALALAAMPALSKEETAQLHSLAGSTWSGWRHAESRRSRWRQVAGLAVAAAVGGLIASAALLRQAPHSPAPLRAVAAEVASTGEEALPLDARLAVSDDEFDPSAYEVPWTDDSLNLEGEAP